MRDIEAHELEHEWTHDRLAATPRGESMWNPFAVLILENSKRAEKLGRAWVILHDGPSGGPVKGFHAEEQGDPLDGFLSAVDDSLGTSPYHLATNPTTGEVTAVFPNVPARPLPADELAWEERALIMHEEQTRIDPDAMPERVRANNLENRKLYHEMTNKQPPAPKFEDLPEELRAKFNSGGLRRGD